MMNWLRKLLGDAPPCESCESLRGEVEHLRYQNKRLLDNLLVKPEPEPVRQPVEVSRPKTVPWPVRRAMLEKDDRETAARIRAEAKARSGAAKPDVPTTDTSPAPTGSVDVADLEEEMGLVEKERTHGT